VLVHRPTPIVGLPTDLDEHLIEMLFVPRTRTAPTQPGGVGLPELGTPSPHRLVAEGDPPLQHYPLHLAKTEREPVVKPHTMADDLHREADTLVQRRNGLHQPQSCSPMTRQSILPGTARRYHVDDAVETDQRTFIGSRVAASRAGGQLHVRCPAAGTQVHFRPRAAPSTQG
jgi:hypothetical protein